MAKSGTHSRRHAFGATPRPHRTQDPQANDVQSGPKAWESAVPLVPGKPYGLRFPRRVPDLEKISPLTPSMRSKLPREEEEELLRYREYLERFLRLEKEYADQLWCPCRRYEEGWEMIKCGREVCAVRWYHRDCVLGTGRGGAVGDPWWWCDACVEEWERVEYGVPERGKSEEVLSP